MPTDPRWLDDAEQRAWRSYLDMHTRLMARLGREMQEQTGLSSSDFPVLVQLSEHPDDRMRAHELGTALGWEKSRLSHQLTRMQSRGLVQRTNCAEDRRGAWIGLTAAGRRAVEQAAPQHVESVRTYVFDQLDPAEVEVLAAISRTVLARLDADEDAGAADTRHACAQDTPADDAEACDSVG